MCKQHKELAQSLPVLIPFPALIQSAIARLPVDGEVTIAVDFGEGGDQLTQSLTRLFEAAGRKDLALTVDVPKTRGFEWNKALTNG